MNKNILRILLLQVMLFCAMTVSSQTQAPETINQQPTFIGGNEAFLKFLKDSIDYPVIAQESGIQGRVVLEFMIEKDGSIGEVKVLKSVDRSLEKEAIRVIKLTSGRWMPGVKEGKIAATKVTYPVMFRLTQKK